MQDQMVDCEECSTESEDFECATCGQTGEEIANARWHKLLWEAVTPAQ